MDIDKIPQTRDKTRADSAQSSSSINVRITLQASFIPMSPWYSRRSGFRSGIPGLVRNRFVKVTHADLCQTMVRERASMLLSACLEIIKTREKSPNEKYRRIFDEARSGLLKASSTDTVLGSLLAFGAMIQNQQIVR